MEMILYLVQIIDNTNELSGTAKSIVLTSTPYQHYTVKVLAMLLQVMYTYILVEVLR